MSLLLIISNKFDLVILSYFVSLLSRKVMKRASSSTEAVAIDSEYESDDDSIPMAEIGQLTANEGNSILVFVRKKSFYISDGYFYGLGLIKI